MLSYQIQWPQKKDFNRKTICYFDNNVRIQYTLNMQYYIYKRKILKYTSSCRKNKFKASY